ncbi:MAG: hypothetical protein P8N43_06010, partial [Alphaproteobacteria bacterium]|nr:hypothetical protein [Alphaproteobacteria bacterium]
SGADHRSGGRHAGLGVVWIVSVMSNSENDHTPIRGADMVRGKRGRNLAVLLAIFVCCGLFYLITIVRMFTS